MCLKIKYSSFSSDFNFVVKKTYNFKVNSKTSRLQKQQKSNYLSIIIETTKISMKSVLQMNKTSFQTIYNTNSQLNNARKNVEIEELQETGDWSNNQPLFILIGCLFIISFCVVLSWFINTYLPRRSSLSEALTNEEFDYKNDEILVK